MARRTSLVVVLAWMGSTQLTVMGQSPDPLALLRGTEQYRRLISSGVIDLTLDETDYSSGTARNSTIKVKIVFDGVKRTVHQHQYALVATSKGQAEDEAQIKQFESLNRDPDKAAKAGLGRKEYVRRSSAFDGSRFSRYTPEYGAAYSDLKGGTPTVFFEPRLLGIVELYNQTQDYSAFLPVQKAKAVSTVGKEQVNGQATWHIVLDSNGFAGLPLTFHYWIEDREPFRIHKVSYVSDKDRSSVVSFYGSDGNPLPRRVVTERYFGDKLNNVIKATVHSMELNKPVDPNVGTLASLIIAKGDSVIDETAHRGLGKWDGKEVVPYGPPEGGSVQSRRAVGPWFVVGGLAAAAILVTAVYLHRRARRLGA